MLICCTIELQHPVISLLIGVIRSPLTPKRRLFVLSSNFLFLSKLFSSLPVRNSVFWYCFYLLLLLPELYNSMLKFDLKKTGDYFTRDTSTYLKFMALRNCIRISNQTNKIT